MFSIKSLGTFPGSHYEVRQLFYNDKGICQVVMWGFHSCACYHLQGFGSYPAVGIDVDAMFKYLNGYGKTKAEYCPREYYFMIGGIQRDTDLIKKMIAHPCVQQIDQFKNKSHDSIGVTLWRYSEDKDFAFPLEKV